MKRRVIALAALVLISTAVASGPQAAARSAQVIFAAPAASSAQPSKKVWRWSALYTKKIFLATDGEDVSGSGPKEALYGLNYIKSVKCYGQRGRVVKNGVPVFRVIGCVVEANYSNDTPNLFGSSDHDAIFDVCITPLNRVEYRARWRTVLDIDADIDNNPRNC